MIYINHKNLIYIKMKKFLAILLIAIVACSTASVIEEKEIDLEKLPDWVVKGWSKILETFKKVVEFLKENGLWDQIVSLLKDAGKVAAKKLCLKVYDEEFCDELIGSLLDKEKNGEVVLKDVVDDAARLLKKLLEELLRPRPITPIL